MSFDNALAQLKPTVISSNLNSYFRPPVIVGFPRVTGRPYCCKLPCFLNETKSALFYLFIDKRQWTKLRRDIYYRRGV